MQCIMFRNTPSRLEPMSTLLRAVIPFAFAIQLPALSPSRTALAHLPLGFEQVTERKLVARDGPFTLAVEPGRTTLTVSNRRDGHPSFVTTTLAGANSQSRVEGAGALPGKANYLVGNQQKDWRIGVSRFERAVNREVYPGIDLVFHGAAGTLE